MPLVRVHRIGYTDSTNGTQTVSGNLTINGPTEVQLNSSVHNVAGRVRYLLFSYSGSFSGSISNLSVVKGTSNYSTIEPIDHDTTNRKIYVTVS